MMILTTARAHSAGEDEADDVGVHPVHHGVRHSAQVPVMAPRHEVLLCRCAYLPQACAEPYHASCISEQHTSSLIASMLCHESRRCSAGRNQTCSL